MGIKFIKDETLIRIADAIRGKSATTEPMSPAEMVEAINGISVGSGDDRYDEGYADGDADGYERGFSEGVASVPLLELYATGLKLGSLNVLRIKSAVLNLNNATTFEYFCQATRAEQGVKNQTVETLVINCPNQVKSIQSFLECSTDNADEKLKEVTLNVDLSAATSFRSAFANQKALEVINGTPLDASKNIDFQGAFSNCESLREVRFKGEITRILTAYQSPLSKSSIESIVNCLSTTVSNRSLTLKKSAVNESFETSLGAADGSTSAEWQALIATKPNWTFSLM